MKFHMMHTLVYAATVFNWLNGYDRREKWVCQGEFQLGLQTNDWILIAFITPCSLWN